MTGKRGTMSKALAVDVGGTKLAAGVVDEEGCVLEWEETATPSTSDAEEVFARLLTIARPLASRGATVCGVGCGGPMTMGGEEVSPLNIPAWRGFPLRRRLEQATGLPTYVDNDAKALTLGEGWIGAAAGERDFLGMVVSTGVGGGIVLDGRLLDGAAGNAGHVGHVVVEPAGRRGAGGGRACLEAEASARSVEAVTGRPAAEASAEVVARTGRLVGLAVASVANLLDLRLAVVAGSVARGLRAPVSAAAAPDVAGPARLGAP